MSGQNHQRQEAPEEARLQVPDSRLQANFMFDFWLVLSTANRRDIWGGVFWRRETNKHILEFGFRLRKNFVIHVMTLADERSPFQGALLQSLSEMCQRRTESSIRVF